MKHDVGTKTACNSTLAVSVRSVEAGSVTSQVIRLHVLCDSLYVYSPVDTWVYSHCRHANWANCLLPRHLGSFAFTQPNPTGAVLCSQVCDTSSHTVLFVILPVLTERSFQPVDVDDRGQSVLGNRVTWVTEHCYNTSKGNQSWQTVKYSTKPPKPAYKQDFENIIITINRLGVRLRSTYGIIVKISTW